MRERERTKNREKGESTLTSPRSNVERSFRFLRRCSTENTIRLAPRGLCPSYVVGRATLPATRFIILMEKESLLPLAVHAPARDASNHPRELTSINSTRLPSEFVYEFCIDCDVIRTDENHQSGQNVQFCTFFPCDFRTLVLCFDSSDCAIVPQ